MEAITFTQLPQDAESLSVRVTRAGFVCRYAYARSADSRAAAEAGQDYLLIGEKGRRLAFAVCDGVSQSFFGDLAARLLGEAVVTWLVQAGPAETESKVFAANMTYQLHRLTIRASAEVEAVPIPADLPSLLKEVLEQKRRLGSESMFAAGRLDREEERLELTWMGDIRIRLWGVEGQELTEELNHNLKSAERWSSRQGPIGQIHTFARSLTGLSRLTLYTDGLALLDSWPTDDWSDSVLADLITVAGQEPTSDDLSFLEISFAASIL